MCRHRHHLSHVQPGSTDQLVRSGHCCQAGGGVDEVHLGDHQEHRFATQFGHFAGDIRISGTWPLIGGQAQPDDVHFRPSGAHEIIEPFPEQCARTVQSGCIHHDDLGFGTVDDCTYRVPGGLWPAGSDGHFAAHHGVGQARFAHIRPADQRSKPRSVHQRGSLVTRMVEIRLRRPSSVSAVRV